MDVVLQDQISWWKTSKLSLICLLIHSILTYLQLAKDVI